MVLRAGAGVFYDLGVGASANLAGYFPNQATTFYLNQSVPVVNIGSLVPTISATPPYPSFDVRGFDPNLKLPRSYQWNVALEKSFGVRQAISATYVGQAGRDLLRQDALFQPNANFLGGFGLTGNEARSNYNALQLQYRRPLSSRVQALLNYTYSHSLDNASDDVIAGLSNTVISAANDYASSDFDVRHSFFRRANVCRSFDWNVRGDSQIDERLVGRHGGRGENRISHQPDSSRRRRRSVLVSFVPTLCPGSLFICTVRSAHRSLDLFPREGMESFKRGRCARVEWD